MSLVQMLDCNKTLGTCCTDYGLVAVLDAARNFFGLLQIIVPIVLMVMMTFELIQLLMNPDDKKGIKPLTNKIIATVICFFLPVIVDALLLMMPDSYSVSACWEEAKVASELLRSQNNEYIEIVDGKERSKMLIDSSLYGKGKPKEDPTPGSLSGIGNGSTMGKAIVSYARQFVGQPYVWGGSWNGELPYRSTDCSGFVRGVFKHHGFTIPRTTSEMWNNRASFSTEVVGEIRAGDIVLYKGHVGLLTGNGTEYIHAKSPSAGIVVDQNYKVSPVRGVFRINGVN